MPQLIQLIYSSAAKHLFSPDELTELLQNARDKNLQHGVTGILLYADGSFFQVLEGEETIVDDIFASISRDERHKQVTVIIREPIAKRSFGDWTMGYADISAQEADEIIGASDFFGKGESFAQLNHGRAKKLLSAFKHGRWRAKLSATRTPTSEPPLRDTLRDPVDATPKPTPGTKAPPRRWYTFAYQPIINIKTGQIISYEALIRGLDNTSADQVLKQVSPAEMHKFDEQSRILAIELAASMGISTLLNLNFLPLSLETSPTAITSILSAAQRCNFRTDHIVLEILEREIISDFDRFKKTVNAHRGAGLFFAIDDFGAGHAGLNLLAEFQPEFIKLDMHLVRDVDRKGPRQAIVRGIARTCLDLGIDIIAEGVETEEEYRWLLGEGIYLYQGRLFAAPAFEKLQRTIYLPA